MSRLYRCDWPGPQIPREHYIKTLWGGYTVWCNNYWVMGMDCPHCEKVEEVQVFGEKK